MLIEKRFQENENFALLEFHNVNKETIPWLECLAGEYHCKVEKRNGEVNTTITSFMIMSHFVLKALKLRLLYPLKHLNF